MAVLGREYRANRDRERQRGMYLKFSAASCESMLSTVDGEAPEQYLPDSHSGEALLILSRYCPSSSQPRSGGAGRRPGQAAPLGSPPGRCACCPTCARPAWPARTERRCAVSFQPAAAVQLLPSPSEVWPEVLLCRRGGWSAGTGPTRWQRWSRGASCPAASSPAWRHSPQQLSEDGSSRGSEVSWRRCTHHSHLRYCGTGDRLADER